MIALLKTIQRSSMTTLTTLLLFTLVTSLTLAADEEKSEKKDEELHPVFTVQPMYPTVAADEGIEGWALVSFTVKEDGLVDRSSVEIVDANPSLVFDHNSISAAQQFQFDPQIIDGGAVEVQGVQYLFRYLLN